MSKKRWVIGAGVGLYLYFLLPATAVFFYELYHLTDFGPVYWGYSIFKAAGYYFAIWEYQLLSCVLVAALIIGVPTIVERMKHS